MNILRFGRGGYDDNITLSDVTGFSETLGVQEGDRLSLSSSSASSIPEGRTGTVRIDVDGGAFAESTDIAQLVCCRSPVTGENGSSVKKVELVFAGATFNVPNPPPVEFEFKYRVTDPATGSIVDERSGRATGFGVHTLDMKIGYQIALEATLTSPSKNTRVTVHAAGVTDPLNPPRVSPILGLAGSTIAGVPARLNVFCCSANE
jgi:hypothetical protein